MARESQKPTLQGIFSIIRDKLSTIIYTFRFKKFSRKLTKQETESNSLGHMEHLDKEESDHRLPNEHAYTQDEVRAIQKKRLEAVICQQKQQVQLQKQTDQKQNQQVQVQKEEQKQSQQLQ
jgi:hypothetical protein